MARLKYEEFLRFYLALEINQGDFESNQKKAKDFDINIINDFINKLPFKLTVDQNKAIDDILKDLRSNKCMYRLIQGEVGSGKTLVAFISLYANYLAVKTTIETISKILL